MYELIFWDTGMGNFTGVTFACYVDDIWEFTREWSKQIDDKERIRKFLFAMEGQQVEGNILTGEARQNLADDESFQPCEYLDGVFLLEDPEAKILQHRLVELNDFSFRVEEAGMKPEEFKISHMQVQIRYVNYKGEFLRLLSYYVQGIAICEKGTDGRKKYHKLKRTKNSLVKYEERPHPDYSEDFEEFTGDRVELLAWYPMGYAETLEELQECYGKEKLMLTRQDLEQLFYDFL